MKLKVKRVYDEPDEQDGLRILVDRLWPRGLTKGEVAADLWLRELAPSEGLRKWFSHDADKWGEFMCRYFGELDGRQESVRLILTSALKGPVTLLYGSKDDLHNNAVALREYILSRKTQLKKAA